MDGQRVHVLLVEDEPAHIELIERAFELRADDMSLRVARTLEEARAALGESSPDVLVIDSLLPDGSGLELLSSAGRRPSSPAILMTSHGDERLEAQAREVGVVRFVVKTETTLIDLPDIVERTLSEPT